MVELCGCRLNGLAEQANLRMMVANAHRQLRRADTAACHLLQRLLCDAILQGMERNDGDAAARLQMTHSRLEGLGQDAELIVDLDANGLENPLGRMAIFRAAHGLGHGLTDDSRARPSSRWASPTEP